MCLFVAQIDTQEFGLVQTLNASDIFREITGSPIILLNFKFLEN